MTMDSLLLDEDQRKFMGKTFQADKPVLSSTDRDEYRAFLEGIAANPDIGILANRFPWQAAMATERLLQHAFQHQLPIRILSGSAPEGFYGDNCAKQFVGCRDVGCTPIRVLVWQETEDGIAPALAALADNGVIELKVPKTAANSVPHFLLVGDKAFRQEATHPRFDRRTKFTAMEPEVPARIDFGDERTGLVLKSFFDTLWEQA